jgi:hypothetical protein
MGALTYLFIFIYFSLLTHANAYVDPGTGGSILQMLLAFFAAFFSLIGFYFTKVKLFIKQFIKKFTKKKKDF